MKYKQNKLYDVATNDVQVISAKFTHKKIPYLGHKSVKKIKGGEPYNKVSTLLH